ncbi:MAG: XrtA/PEP-CTERM system histidine kinase PrsK, partial [Gammaproteobacteria bacterium]
LWAAVHVVWTGWGQPAYGVVLTVETLHFVAWFAFLFGLLQHAQKHMRLATVLISILAAAVFLAPFFIALLSVWLPDLHVGIKQMFLGYNLLAIAGLFLVENLYRNTRPTQRWGIKFLCLGIGGMFVYDFFMYAEALLFNQLDTHLWNARGAVYMLVAPLIGISVARNPDWSVAVFISRNAALHTATLMVVGSYLLVMASAGYYLRHFGGEWGAIFQIMFLFGAGVGLVALLFSGQLRARIRVFLGKNFFHHRYDYREQWLNFNNALSLCKREILPYECVVRAIAEVVDSPGGLLWLHTPNGSFEQIAHWGVSGGSAEILLADSSLVRFLQDREWVINLEEYRTDPDIYSYLELPDWVAQLPRAWLVVPLLDQKRLLGFVVITRPRAELPFNWETRDLLKTVAGQAASHLAQLEAVQALADARQFEGFHRLSAYVLHDIKNLIAQQSMLVSTAAQHKHNPEFFDDAIEIIEHSVTKMQRLMQLLRTGMSSSKPVATNLVLAVEDAVNNRSGVQPAPNYVCEHEAVWVKMDIDRMTSVLENLIQNAQDATDAAGSVKVTLSQDDNSASIIVEDSGCGMDAAFIRERLFRPFDTTKGDTGMGIGAYECREYIHSLYGNIHVASEPGEGTTVRITLPAQATELSEDEIYKRMENAG